jgi:hypothetical protein
MLATNLRKNRCPVIRSGKIRRTMGMKSRIEVEDRSKRNPRKRLSVNFKKSRLLNKSRYE